ncbi:MULTISPECIES: preprotein translocase subunit SecE [Atopobiaceae]|uniref:preprotein translocase subunit SecE n=1 Tax=Atopobiaceae TaxID=1643824 RepID=UPI00034E2DA3|nr:MULTISPECIES: preprotein translocase subunit SecE [Atopobiaceae]EPD77345.1 preprotein translocase, SecE subunit [Atopobium sp. oral taxon 199 str. F0494]
MANRERNKRSARKARAAQRAEREATQAEHASVAEAKPAKVAKASAKQEKALERKNNPGFFGRIKNYFAGVRTEMHRVVWPTRTELANWSVAVIGMIIFFGLVTFLVDTGIVAGLVAFTGLRG